MKITKKGTKKFTKKEKLDIIKEAKEKGVKVTLDKYDIYPVNYYYWKNKVLADGETGLDHRTMNDRQQKIKRLEKENQALKILLGEKELESKLNQDMANWNKMITRTLQIQGYYINHKKVYRLMFEYLLLEAPRKRTGRDFVKYRSGARQFSMEEYEK